MIHKIYTIENDERDLIITLTMSHPQPVESATLLVGRDGMDTVITPLAVTFIPPKTFEFVCQNPQIPAGNYFWTLEVISNGRKVILATEQSYIVQREFPYPS